MALVGALIFFGFVLSSRFGVLLGSFGWCFYALAALLQGLLFSLAGWGFFALLLPRWCGRRALWNVLWVVCAWLGGVWLFVDLVLFRLYGVHLTPMLLFDNLGGQGAAYVFSFDPRMLWKVAGVGVALLLGAVLLWLLSDWFSRRTSWRPAGWKPLVGCVLALGLVVNAMSVWAAATPFSGTFHQHVEREAVTNGRYVLPLFSPLTMNSLLSRLELLPKELRQPSELFNVGSGHFDEGVFHLSADSAPQGSNVLLIVLDCFRADALSDSVTPNLWAFGERHALRFMRHRSGSSHTSGGIFSLFYGLPQLYSRAMWRQGVTPPLVAEALERGYEVVAFPSASLRKPDFAQLLFAQVQDGVCTVASGETPFERDAYVAANLAAFLDSVSLQRPFFAFAFLDLPHAKQLTPDKLTHFSPSDLYIDYVAQAAGKDQLPGHNLYRNCVYNTDSLLAPVLHALVGRKLLNNTVVVISGDHAEEFDDSGNGLWGHNACLDSWQTRVPLLLCAPGVETGVVWHQTSHYDVSPTVLRLAYDVALPPSEFCCGRLLTDTCNREPLLLSHNTADWANFDIDPFLLKHALAVGDSLLDLSNSSPVWLNDRQKPLETPVDTAWCRQSLEWWTRFFLP